MNKIKVGLIGCGKQAIKHISSLKKVPGVKMVLSDTQVNLAQNLAEKEKLSWVSHPDEIFSDGGIEAVIISTPTHTHISLIKRAVDSEKAIFCEKPLTDSIEKARVLKKMITHSGQIFMVGYIYRFSPVFIEGFRLFREKQVNGESLVMGRPLYAFFRLGGIGGHQIWKHKKKSGGGAINEMLVHMIDLANWYFGPIRNVEVVSCSLRCPKRYIQGELVDVDAEDFVLIKCIGNCGIEIICQADLITPSFCQYVEIQSENGSFMGSIQDDLPSHVFLKESRGGYSTGKTLLQYGHINLFDTQMMDFVQLVLQGRKPNRNTVNESLQLMEIHKEITKQLDS